MARRRNTRPKTAGSQVWGLGDGGWTPLGPPLARGDVVRSLPLHALIDPSLALRVRIVRYLSLDATA